ncbi:MAG: outer membrane protein transport protein [Pseudomonadota bacterium]
MRRHLLKSFVGILALAFAASPALGAGIELQEQSAAAMGRVLAVKARLEDASTVFFNPAGLAYLRGFQIQAGDNLVFPVFTAHDARDVPAGESWGSDTTTNKLVAPPHAYFSWGTDVGSSGGIGVGAGVNFPFGLAMTWPDDFAGRHLIAGSNMMIPEILVGMAYAPVKQISFGATLVVSPAQIWLQKYLGPDFGLVGDDGSPLTDSTVTMSGFGVGIGANVGLQARPVEGLYLGFAYRSRIALKMEGDAHFNLDGLADQGGFPDQAVKTEFQLPDIFSLAVGYQILDAWYAEIDVEYTLWSLFKDIPLTFPDDGTGSLSQAIPQDWRDTVTVRFGNEITLGERQEWAIRAGAGYDPTPATSKYLSPMLPDSDRIFAAIGGGYEFDFGLGIDLSYLHTFFLPREVHGHPCTAASVEPACAAAAGGPAYDASGNVLWSGNRFPARYTNDAHLLAITVSQKF